MRLLRARFLLLAACLCAGAVNANAEVATRHHGPVYILDLRHLNHADLGSSTNATRLWDTLHTSLHFRGWPIAANRSFTSCTARILGSRQMSSGSTGCATKMVG